MGIALGNNALRGVRYGSRPVTQIRLGDRVVWSPSAMRDSFDRGDGDMTPWQPIAGTAFPYVATVVNGSCRMNIPEGLIFDTLRTATHRFIGATAQSDNGILKIRVGSRGDDNGAIYTQVFSWMPNDASASHGVGIELRASNLYIVRRVAGVDTLMVHCGSYLAGEEIWLATNDRTYSMYRNGKFVGAWPDDAASAARGPFYRSMGLVVRGWKDLLGPRRFSAAIDNIEHT